MQLLARLVTRAPVVLKLAPASNLLRTYLHGYHHRVRSYRSERSAISLMQSTCSTEPSCPPSSIGHAIHKHKHTHTANLGQLSKKLSHCISFISFLPCCCCYRLVYLRASTHRLYIAPQPPRSSSSSSSSWSNAQSKPRVS